MPLSEIQNPVLQSHRGGPAVRATTPSERRARRFDTILVAARSRRRWRWRSGRDRSALETLPPNMEMSGEVCRTKSSCSLLRLCASADRPVRWPSMWAWAATTLPVCYGETLQTRYAGHE